MKKVELFIPCFMDQLLPYTAQNTVKVLEKAGCTVHYNPEQTCCGQPQFNAGYWDLSKKTGNKFLQDFSENTAIVSPGASCVSHVKNSFNDLFTNTNNHNRCRNIQSNIYELSDFLVNIVQKIYFGAELEGKAVYHDACSALRGCQIKVEPRILLQQVGGLQLIESPDAETCCGFGGSFSLKFKELSSAMAENKVENAMELGADYIISTDASCLMHMQSYIDHHNLPIQTWHLSDVIAHGWANI